MDSRPVLPGPPADPIRRLFWTLGDPAAHHRSSSYDERRAVFMKALGDYVELIPQASFVLSHAAEFYFHATKKALADPDHVADHFIEILASAGKRFRVGDSSFAWQSTGNPAGEAPDDDHPGSRNLEARWHRFAEWTTQGRRDGYKNEALASDIEPDAIKDKIYEDELEEYANIPLDLACGFCGKADAIDNCSECDVSDDGALVETTYCNEDCRVKHLDDHEAHCRSQMNLYRYMAIVHKIIQRLLTKTYSRPVSMVKGNRQGLRILGYPIVGDRWTRAVTPTSEPGGGDRDLPDNLGAGPYLGTRDHRNDTLQLSQELERRRDEITRTIDDPRAFVGGLVIGRFRSSAVRTRREKTLTAPGLSPSPDPATTLAERFRKHILDCSWPEGTRGGPSMMGASRFERQEIRDQIIKRNTIDEVTDAQKKIFQMDCNAAVLYGVSEEALVLAMPLLREFLIPLCDKVEVVAIVPKNARVAVTWCGRQSTPIHISGNEGEAEEGIAQPVDTVRNNMSFDHHVLRATLKTGQQFAIDFTGGQYGWQQYLCPWGLYETFRIHQIISVEDLVVRVDESHPNDATTREGIAHALRSQIMRGVMDAIKDLIPEVKNTARFSERDFKPTVAALYELVKETIQQAKNNFKEEGLFRLFLDDEFRVQVTTTSAQVAKYRNVWLTAEEVHFTSQQYGSMLRVWKRKLGDPRPATPIFAPAPPLDAYAVAELFDWNDHTWFGHHPRGPLHPLGRAPREPFEFHMGDFIMGNDFDLFTDLDVEHEFGGLEYLVGHELLPWEELGDLF